MAKKNCRCRCRLCRRFCYEVHGKEIEKDNDVEITLIDRHSYHTMMTELHEVAGGRVEPTAIQYDLQRLFSRKKNVRLVTDTVTGIDKENKTVQTKLGSYSFDYLILGMGGEPNDFGTPGVKKMALLYGHLTMLSAFANTLKNCRKSSDRTRCSIT